ncbi:hypothetical protein BUALT_Bualt16G0070100 [Buddleja alternifolia]|uniref:Uncharacterized protein n=1 Tax=Buddleja alternifolia TaxID=168488 RepID=A0AAV6W7I8_9LAMI|nr:hypothetical protein BUALT_Bualt16G0070100 [Buddleja alternifolia]
MEGIKDVITLEPTDHYKTAYILHFFLGAGNLLPWNALITAVDYFGYLYPEKHVEKVFSVVYMTSSLIVLCVMLIWECCSWQRISLRLRMSIGYSMFLISLMATPIMHWARGDTSSSTSYYMVVASVLTCGLADGVIGGSLIGTAAKLPKQYMQAVFVGTASSGFLAENIKSDLLKDWYPIMLIATYNISDFSGKSLTGLYVMKGIGKATWGCMARLLFYPLFIGCFRGPEWLRTEAPVVLLTVMLGLSNGYLTSVIMMLAPKTVPEVEAEVAAIVMAVLLGMGLFGRQYGVWRRGLEVEDEVVGFECGGGSEVWRHRRLMSMVRSTAKYLQAVYFTNVLAYGILYLLWTGIESEVASR